MEPFRVLHLDAFQLGLALAATVDLPIPRRTTRRRSGVRDRVGRRASAKRSRSLSRADFPTSAAPLIQPVMSGR